jgi:hypothetical protein|nr:MAG TPA: hypothetical protein [Caudoviricetes sp.]
MKIIYNNTIPFGRFAALTVLFWLFIRRGKELTERLLNHEKIHMRQQLEIVAACLVINATLIGLTGCSWWWMLASVVAPFIVYGLSVGIEWLLPPRKQAYKNSCFETEAIYNEHKRSYTRRWWRHLFAWLRYIPNGKYPYIPHSERPPMQD